ncbi:hypothetical protein WJX73_001819 [Symbiochloris irregularis]|uniref:Uncharacterized protein n=1 Tax=Symbiochloris irregularis TaxID=706552 RepID=A0AAW1PG77_9CHLO
MGQVLSHGAHKTAYEIQQGHDLRGKLAIVTGGSSGIGLETARQLVHAGAKVIITSPHLQRARECATNLSTTARGIDASNIIPMELQLASFRSVRKFVEDVKAMNCNIDYLILNAAVMGCPLWRTREDFEYHLGVNYIAHVHLTQLMLEHMIHQTVPSRILVVTCRSGLEGSGVHLADMNFRNRVYDAGAAYHQSKLALSYFAMELAIRLDGTKIVVLLVHPGIVPTSLSRWYGPLSLIYAGLAASWTKTVQQAAATSLYACVQKSLENKSGSYLQDCSVTKMPGRNSGNPHLWSKVWEMTQDMIDGAQIDSNCNSLNPGIKIMDWFWSRYIDPVLHYCGYVRGGKDSKEADKSN